MKKTLLMLCMLFMLTCMTSTTYAQTHSQQIESIKLNLIEINALIECRDHSETQCVEGEDLVLLVEKKLYLEELLDALGLTDDNPNSGTGYSSASPSNPHLYAVYTQLLRQAENDLKELRRQPEPDAEKMQSLETRIGSLKAKLD